MSKTNIGDVKSRLILIQLGLTIAFIIIALTLVYWSVIRGPSILVRDDNPRQVDAVLNTVRGRILDANGLTLAETRNVDGELIRQYATNGTGPIVGYYSFRHGTAGVEGGYDQILSGERDDSWSEFFSYDVLHRPRQGQDIRLTLDSHWQKKAESLLEEEQGAVILFSVSDMEILAMVSQPSYDPNLLDEQFDNLIDNEAAPLLNRATQGQYQPGFMLQPFLLASLAAANMLDLESRLSDIENSVIVNGLQLECKLKPPLTVTLAELMVYQCPQPLLDLSATISAEEIGSIFDELGFFSAPEILIESDASVGSAVLNREQAMIGQGQLAVSPLQIAMVAAALANNGVLSQPDLVAAVQNTNGRWIDQDQLVGDRRIFDDIAANKILESLPNVDGIFEYSSLVPSGSDKAYNAWYIGLAPSNNPDFGVVVILENKEELSSVEDIGRSLLTETKLDN